MLARIFFALPFTISPDDLFSRTFYELVAGVVFSYFFYIAFFTWALGKEAPKRLAI